MLRARLGDALKSAMKAKVARRVSTLRLILAALKDRDIAARGDGNAEGIPDDDILNMLATMIRQRRDSIVFYKKGGRDDLVRQEQEESEIINDFLPKQLDEQEMEAASREMIAETTWCARSKRNPRSLMTSSPSSSTSRRWRRPAVR